MNMMASCLLSQISSVKCLNHGSIPAMYAARHMDIITAASMLPVETGIRALAATSRGSVASIGEEQQQQPQAMRQRGRFVRRTPGPMTLADAYLRPALRLRIAHGPKEVARNARITYLRRQTGPPHRLLDASCLAPSEEHMRRLRRAFERSQSVVHLQPRCQVPFCARDAPNFTRENIRPPRYMLLPARRHFSTAPSTYSSTYSTGSEDADSMKSTDTFESDNISLSSYMSTMSEDTAVSDDVLSIPEETPAPVPNHSLNERLKTASNPSKAHVGYNFTQLFSPRPYSTMPPRDCCANRPVVDKTPWKHPKGEPWTKCECCPEMLPCDDEREAEREFPFPCEEDDGEMQVAAPAKKCCPPPPIPPPPPPAIPLSRIPQGMGCQHQPECATTHCTENCQLVEPKTLCALPKGSCKRPKPFVPSKMPKMKTEKQRVYQCIEECESTTCAPRLPPPVVRKNLPPLPYGAWVPPRRPPPPSPPLARLNLSAHEPIVECKETRCIPPSKPHVEQRTLPPICSKGCVCVEIPPPPDDVRLVRLPPICMCPPPPDPTCEPEKCPLRADDVCKWRFPKKMLRNWWCPEESIPQSPHRWCNRHSRHLCTQRLRDHDDDPMRPCSSPTLTADCDRT